MEMERVSISAKTDGKGELAPESGEAAAALPASRRSSVVFPRLQIGLVVLICTEVFSGASIQVGLWHPWTWLVTYWLYFAHFFFFTTLAVRTGRTSLAALYLWGVLFGLYESWITKVIWSGYRANGELALGAIGPYGLSEISMVLFFHPVAAFILPLAVACLLYPSLRGLFPGLAWLSGRGKLARAVQAYLAISFVSVMAMNSGGPVRFSENVAFILAVLLLVSWRARATFSSENARPLVVFGRRGFVGLCIYLVLLYGIAYRALNYQALPSIPVQLLTFVFYALAAGGIWAHRKREPLSGFAVQVEPRELRLVKTLFVLMLVLALALSTIRGTKVIQLAALLSLVVWPYLGFLLAAAALADGVRERSSPLHHR